MSARRTSICGILGRLALATIAVALASPSGKAAEPPGDDARALAQAKTQTDRKSDDQALKEFLEIYRLAPGQIVKRVPPPRPEGMRVYWKREHPGFENRVDRFGAMTFRFSDPDRLVNWSMTTGNEGFSIRELLQYLEMDIYPVEIDGDPELMETPIKGDWIYRAGAPAEQTLAALESTVQRALRLSPRHRITMQFRQVERDVVVVRGQYRYAPVAGRSKNQVEIYGKQIVPGGGGAGGGTGKFGEFLKWVGEWIERPVVSEVEAPPKGNIEWFYNARSPFTRAMRQEDHDEVLVLKHLKEQTGLSYTRERKKIRILFVERPK